jgi:hypothetical protein
MSREPYYDNKRNYSNGSDLLSPEYGKIDMLEKEVYNVQKSLYSAYIRIKELKKLHDKLHNNVSIKDIDNLQLEFKF